MIIDLFLDEIYDHFYEEYPREGCGILCVKKGKPYWVPCTNVAEDDEDFVIDSTEYLKVRRTSNIIGIVHSHPDADATPSEGDIKYCNALGIPYYIFSFPDMNLEVLKPEKNTTELYGREYEFGVTDCFEAARDYLAKQGIEIAPRAAFEDDWWEKSLDYFNDEMMKEWGFSPVPISDVKNNDVLVFNIGAAVGTHCGIYTGGDNFFHHAVNRLSCIENLYPFWIKNLQRVYRYDA
jgi:proteasome lid subunit RPN8/RPN11